MIWNTQKPFSESAIYTNSELHFRLQDQNNITPLESPRHHFLAKLLLNTLSANVTAIENDFDVQIRQTEHISKADLRPRKTRLQKVLEKIVIEKVPRALSITITNKRQERTHIKIDNTQILDDNGDMGKQCKTHLPEQQSACAILLDPEWHNQLYLKD